MNVHLGRLGLVSSHGGVKLVTVPCAKVCVTPVVVGPLAAQPRRMWVPDLSNVIKEVGFVNLKSAPSLAKGTHL